MLCNNKKQKFARANFFLFLFVHPRVFHFSAHAEPSPRSSSVIFTLQSPPHQSPSVFLPLPSKLTPLIELTNQPTPLLFPRFSPISKDYAAQLSSHFAASGCPSGGAVIAPWQRTFSYTVSSWPYGSVGSSN